MVILDSIEEAIADIKAGKMVVVIDDEGRENEGDLIMAASKATPIAVNFMVKEGRGLICVPVADEIAERLQLYPMVTKNTEKERTDFTVSVDYAVGTTTGISAEDRAKTARALASNKTLPQDLLRPGHIFPIRAKKKGVLVRTGHTEAAVDLMVLAGLPPAGLLCEIMNDDGTMARLPQLQKFAKKHKLRLISIKDLIIYRFQHEKLLMRSGKALLPTDYGDFNIVAYLDPVTRLEHLAIIKGNITSKDPILVRLHSECLTGEALHSQRCDCGPQLAMALQKIEEAGKGVVLYLRQEGRGIGLFNKIEAYQLQDQGYDTIEANKKLGFEADLREYNIAAQMLKDLGVDEIQLMTNNPHKIQDLKTYGIKVIQRVSLEIKPHKENKKYLETKKRGFGHLLKNV